MEVFYEKNVVNNDIDKHKKRNIVLNVLRVLSVAMIIAAAAFVFNFQAFPVSSGGLALALSVAVAVLIVGAPVLFTVLLTKLMGRLNSEFDYYILGDSFRIVRVINRKKRKKVAEFPLSSVSAVGLVESENFDRYAADRTVRRLTAACNEDAVLLYIYVASGERMLVIVEADDELKIALRRSLPLSVFDDTLKKIDLRSAKQ